MFKTRVLFLSKIVYNRLKKKTIILKSIHSLLKNLIHVYDTKLQKYLKNEHKIIKYYLFGKFKFKYAIKNKMNY